MERRLAAILVADVVDYTIHMQRDEENTIRELKSCLEVLQQSITEHSGRIVKSMGDGVLAEFGSVVDAVVCADSIQRLFADLRASRKDQIQLLFRIGVHTGDVVVDGEDILGDGVNIAARLEAVAEPGGIAVSEKVYLEVADKVDISLVDNGQHHLKNIQEPLRVFCSDGGILKNAVQMSKPRAMPSLAVLPFRNLSPNSDDEHFAHGVVEEITAALSRIREFFVISRQSAYAFGGADLDARKVGRALNVNYLVEGSVRRSGDRIRVTVRLADTENGTQIWTDRFDGKTTDHFDLQDDIASQVAGSINPNIRASEIQLAKRMSPTNMDAYYSTLRSFPHFWAHRKEENSKALSYLDEALNYDPDYGVALAYKSWCHAQQACYLWSDEPLDDREAAVASAEQASLKVDDHAGALIAIGATYSISTNESELARSFVDRALELDTNNAWGWMRAGWLEVHFGEPDIALENFNRSIALSPNDPFLFNTYFGMAAAHAKKDDLNTAIHLVEKGLRAGPGVTWAYRMLAAFHMLAGNEEKSHEALGKLLHYNPGLTIEKLKAGMPPGYVLSGPEYIGLVKSFGVPEN